jgi:hypothetical protein
MRATPRGLVPAADARAAIGGAPSPLLRSDDGTFLERAVAQLREAGVQGILVSVRDPRGPVAAAARRAGAEVIEVSGAEPDPVGSLRAAMADEADPPGEEPAWLVLPPAFSLLRPDTLTRILEGWRTAPEAVRLVAPDAAPSTPWRSLAPIIVHGAPGLEALDAACAGREPERGHLLRIPVQDPGSVTPVDTLAVYRRHFPAVYRKRFQKW